MIAPEHLREEARAIFSGLDPDHKPCQECGGVHARACPRIRSVRTVIDSNGIVTEREVTYWPPGQWEHDIIFWDDINEPDGTRLRRPDAEARAGASGNGRHVG